jgi:hypothetical protein
MRTALYTLAWVFVISVGVYDAVFAWHYRAGFQSWELNPVARWAAGTYGLGAVLALKTFAIAFAALVAVYCHRRRHPIEAPYTAVVGGVHLMLSVHYLLAHLAA